MAKVPVVKRFFGITNPYSKFARDIDKIEEKDTLETWIENKGMDALVDGYLYHDNTTRKEIFEYVRKTAKDLKTRDRLIKRFQWEEAIKSLPEKSFWKSIKRLSVEGKAQAFVDRLDNVAGDEERTKQLWREFDIISRAGEVISDEFILEVGKLRRR